jgi:predicted ferric reductase
MKFLYSFVKTGIVRVRSSVQKWYTIFVDHEERRNYLAEEGNKNLWILLYILLNLIALIYPLVKYIPIAKTTGHPWLVVAKCGGWLLNLNCSLILYPTMRSVLNLAISLKLNYIAPLDKNLVFHRTISYVIVLGLGIHAFGHYMNFSAAPDSYNPVTGQPPGSYPSWIGMWGSKVGFTGHFICALMIFMYATASRDYRRSNNFTVFWYVHHLFILFYAALLIHAANFWLFLLPPGTLYIVERLLRMFRGSFPAKVKRVNFLKGDIVNLEIDHSGFHYEAGQYAFLNCASISKQEWHPFTISSCPEQERVTFHIKAVGDWTRALKDVFNPTKKDVKFVDDPLNTNGMPFVLAMDGPFGTCAEYVYEYQYVCLVAAGVGVTPYASLLRQFRHKLQNEQGFGIKKVFFYWINRDEGSFEWFSELLSDLESQYPDFFEIHTFMTGGLEAEKIRNIFHQSVEYLEKNQDIEVVCKATHSYTAKGFDELDLSSGDTISVIERDESGWWTGINTVTKQRGLFPCNYVTIIDKVTGLEESRNRHYGRPEWPELFGSVQKQVELTESKKVGVFACGPAAISKQLKENSALASRKGNVQFCFFKENF